MTVLVAYATAHGSTREVAERIAARLALHAVESRLSAAREVADLAPFDAVVLGSAIHNSGWDRDAVEVLRRAVALPAPPRLWLFSVGTVGDRSSMVAPPVASLLRQLMRRSGWPRNIAPLLTHPSVRDHRAFAGVLRREHYPLSAHLIFRAMGGRYGDHRPWSEIDDWADGIAREVTRRDYSV